MCGSPCIEGTSWFCKFYVNFTSPPSIPSSNLTIYLVISFPGCGAVCDRIRIREREIWTCYQLSKAKTILLKFWRIHQIHRIVSSGYCLCSGEMTQAVGVTFENFPSCTTYLWHTILYVIVFYETEIILFLKKIWIEYILLHEKMHNMAAVEYAVNTPGSPLNFLQENLCCTVEQSVLSINMSRKDF